MHFYLLSLKWVRKIEVTPRFQKVVAQIVLCPVGEWLVPLEIPYTDIVTRVHYQSHLLLPSNTLAQYYLLMSVVRQ